MPIRTSKKALASALLLVSLTAGLTAGAHAETTLRAVMQSDLKILDPIWTTAYITRDHGFMVYDTLFAPDAQGNIQPQMVDHYTLSDDKKVYTLTLRDGLLWHDGKPVTSEDCIASIKRWGARDVLGQQLMTFIASMDVIDSHTFRITLNEPTSIVLMGLGSVTGPAFIMPKRVADTDPQQQISDFTGSGPFVFKTDEWKPGSKAVYVRFTGYKPRSDAPSGLAGAKIAKVDRVEWDVVSDQQTAVNALLNGEVDLIEQPSHDLLPTLEKDKNIQFGNWTSLGNQYVFRFNSLLKPFDNEKVRQAMWYALNQKDFLEAVVGDPKYYQICKSIFMCGTPLASDKGTQGLLDSNVSKARELLKEGGYDGTPVVLLQATDRDVYANLAPVAKSLLEQAGMKVDMQSMDWQTNVMRRSKKVPVSQGGWNISLTSTNNATDPLNSSYLNSSCGNATFGWPCDKVIEDLRAQYAREPDLTKQKIIAEKIQEREIENPGYIPIGQWYQPMAARKSVTGLTTTPVPIFWGLGKTGQ